MDRSTSAATIANRSDNEPAGLEKAPRPRFVRLAKLPSLGHIPSMRETAYPRFSFADYIRLDSRPRRDFRRDRRLHGRLAASPTSSRTLKPFSDAVDVACGACDVAE